MDDTLPTELTSELVAQYPDRASFERAVTALIAAGFERTDLSVLATHDSLEVAGDIAGYKPDPEGSVVAGLAGEMGFLGSIGIAGALLLAAGPVGVAAAAVVAAGAGALALRPFFDELTESAHAAGFTQAIEKGRILLWVRTADAPAVERACALLKETGGANVIRLANFKHETPL
jgi:hypothetical protein